MRKIRIYNHKDRSIFQSVDFFLFPFWFRLCRAGGLKELRDGFDEDLKYRVGAGKFFSLGVTEVVLSTVILVLRYRVEVLGRRELRP
uniref:Uncharacterized protein n=1 Tax=Candidatus Kentrum sp. LFY TaxID=2126342 RepID=A0A450X3W0_9GAMM|nr:MAG: hypothetical protein BECKLFY1418C_GA0070996_11621 [Candidatus Kentron sp. LFY]